VERVAELRKELTERAIGRLADMMATTAAETLARLATSAKSEQVQLDSAKAVYELFINVTNSADLKSRLEQMEAEMRRDT
jgi:hypothetical protein